MHTESYASFTSNSWLPWLGTGSCLLLPAGSYPTKASWKPTKWLLPMLRVWPALSMTYRNWSLFWKNWRDLYPKYVDKTAGKRNPIRGKKLTWGSQNGLKLMHMGLWLPTPICINLRIFEKEGSFQSGDNWNGFPKLFSIDPRKGSQQWM